MGNDKPQCGSVLIFAVVVLAVLAMLSTAFLVVARHAIAASRSSLNGMQTDSGVAAGEAHAQGMLKASNKGNYTVTADGVVQLAPADADYPAAHYVMPIFDGLSKGPATTSPLSAFSYDSAFDLLNTVTTPSFAVLSAQYPDVNPNFFNPNGSLKTPFYTSAPLRIRASNIASTHVADRAAAHYIRAGMTEFFHSATPGLVKTLPSVGTVRARHFVWVRDLDDHFYGIPAMWGLNTKGVPTYSASETTIATGILEFLRTTPAAFSLTNDAGAVTGKTMHAADPAFIAGLPPATYDWIGAFALQFPAYENDVNAPYWRADLENYFTTYLDVLRNSDGNPETDSQGNYIAQCKNHPAAININTAPEEILQAMFSQIPYTDTVSFSAYFPPGVTAIPPNTNPPSMAELIAKRIVAKRPFMCRMEFEDFVASLLPGDPAQATLDLGVKTNNPTPTFPLGMINEAIKKRIPYEITVAQFLEIPGLIDDASHPASDLSRREQSGADDGSVQILSGRGRQSPDARGMHAVGEGVQ